MADLRDLFADIEPLQRKLKTKMLHHLGGNNPDLDDLVQASLARFIRANQSGVIRSPEELRAFLNGVCRNVILEYRRRIRRESIIDPEASIPEAMIRPEGAILEMRNAIDHGLAELAERDRAILRSLYLEGKDKEEICKEWDMSDAQFRVVLFRAKERFRRVYEARVKPIVRTEVNKTARSQAEVGISAKPQSLLEFHSSHASEIEIAADARSMFLLDYLHKFGPMLLPELVADLGLGELPTRKCVEQLASGHLVDGSDASPLKVTDRGVRLIQEVLPE